MSILRPRLAFALASLVLVCGAVGVGCHKANDSDPDDGDEPSETAPAHVDAREVGRTLGLDANQQAQFDEIEGRGEGQGGHRHGGRNHGARIERRVQRISRALGLTPEQTEKLRLIFRDQAARAARRRAMQPGAEDPRFPQGGGDGPQGGWRSRRGGRGDPQGGPGDPQGGGGWRSRWGGRGGPQGGPEDPQGPDGPGGGRHFRHGGHGFPQGGPGDEPQDPEGPPEYPEGPPAPTDI